MNETNTHRDVAIKILTIIGFAATILLLAWLIIVGVKKAPAAFSSLASIAESINTYRPLNEISIATEKTVVNSGESFQISWTDLKQAGEYHFNYTCVEGVSLLVRGGDGALVPMNCENTLSLPNTVHGLFLSVNSGTMRFTDVPFKVSFTNSETTESIETETKITVVNATIPTRENPPVVVKPIPKPTEPETSVKPKPTPVATRPSMYPQSNPNGYIDLSVTTLGSGTLTNGVFSYTSAYDRNVRSALRFDIKNIGTKTSGTWTFKTILPSGEVYTSVPQIALGPQEHIEFTIGFVLTNEHTPAKITTTAYTVGDTNSANNQTVVDVAIRN